MTRRRATILLHWANLVLLVLLLASGRTGGVLGWAFVATGCAMLLIAVTCGLMNGPGPILQGALRRLHPWLSRLMYALLAWAVLSVLVGLFGLALPVSDPRAALLTLFSAALLHGCFHLWRASALNDGALRRMLP